MKRILLGLTLVVGLMTPAMSQDLLGTLFGSPQVEQSQSRPTSRHSYYGRQLRRAGNAIFGPMAAMITTTANRYGVPPALVHAIAHKESGGRCIRGRGIMQVNPRTRASLGIRGNSCADNLAAGVLYLKQSIAMHGYGCAAFSAYQSGLGVHRCSAYGRSIMTLMRGGVSGPRVQLASYRHHAHHRTRYASRHRARYAFHHHHHYSRYARA